MKAKSSKPSVKEECPPKLGDIVYFMHKNTICKARILGISTTKFFDEDDGRTLVRVYGANDRPKWLSVYKCFKTYKQVLAHLKSTFWDGVEEEDEEEDD